MREFALVLMLVACGAESTTGDPPITFDPSTAPMTALATTVAGVGTRCASGRDCAGGLVCTNVMSIIVTQCELPWPAGACPDMLRPILAASAETGGSMTISGRYCVRRCHTGGDCLHDQCCLDFTDDTEPWCVYHQASRWPAMSLRCG